MIGERTNKTYVTHETYMSYSSNQKLILPHGGYRNLKSFQTAQIIYDLTVIFCERFIDRTHGTNRTYDQMVQAARSGCQNLAEGSEVSGTSKKMEIKLVGVARGSLEELLRDYEDFLRQKRLFLWKKDDSKVLEIRKRSYEAYKTYKTYLSYLQSPESAANCLVCLVNQANFLIDRQLKSLEEELLKNGGFTERLYSLRKSSR